MWKKNNFSNYSKFKKQEQLCKKKKKKGLNTKYESI